MASGSEQGHPVAEPAGDNVALNWRQARTDRTDLEELQGMRDPMHFKPRTPPEERRDLANAASHTSHTCGLTHSGRRLTCESLFPRSGHPRCRATTFGHGGNLDGRSVGRNLQLDNTRRQATDVFTNFPARRVMGCMQPIDASDWSSIAAEICSGVVSSKQWGPSAREIGLVAPETRSHDGPTGLSVNKGQTNAPMILPASW